MPSHPIDEFADRLLLDYLRLRPDLAANLGIERVGATALANDNVPDYSDNGGFDRRTLVAARRREFRRMERRAATSEQATTAAVLEYLLEDGSYPFFPGVAHHQCTADPYPVTQLNGAHADIVTLLSRDHGIRTQRDAEDYLCRLEGLAIAVDQSMKCLIARRKQKCFAHRAIIDKVIADLEKFILPPATGNDLYRDFIFKLNAAAIADTGSRLPAQAERILEAQVYPAYRNLLNELAYHRKANEQRYGLWHVAGSDDDYRYCLQASTTTDLTPAAVHEKGLRDIGQLHCEIRAAFAELGIAGSDIAALYRQLDNDDDRATAQPDALQRRRLLAAARREVAQMRELCRPLFNLWPSRTVTVEPLPEVLEDSVHSHYIPAGAAERRGAKFMLNLKHSLNQKPWELATLCHHESYPGHHLQLQLAQELSDLPLLRRNLLFNAYLEGWAKYAETLPISEGFVRDPRLILGRLRSELYSTVNLALDTGVHWKRWSREQAIGFFRKMTGAGEYFAAVVADRSAAKPGQLCSYKIGLDKVRGYRERFAKARGAHFDLRECHDALLRHGALPLKLMDRIIAETLTRQQAS